MFSAGLRSIFEETVVQFSGSAVSKISRLGRLPVSWNIYPRAERHCKMSSDGPVGMRGRARASSRQEAGNCFGGSWRSVVGS